MKEINGASKVENPGRTKALTRTSPDVLPNCIARSKKLVNRGASGFWVPIFCANCGTDGGLVPEAACDFTAYLCESCAEKWSPLFGTMLIPDEVFWEKVKQEQIERFGRELLGEEVAEALKDEHHILTKLARDRKWYAK